MDMTPPKSRREWTVGPNDRRIAAQRRPVGISASRSREAADTLGSMSGERRRARAEPGIVLRC
jgi:hypothetical protein